MTVVAVVVIGSDDAIRAKGLRCLHIWAGLQYVCFVYERVRQLRRLWHHRDVARRALEVGAILAGNDLEAVRDKLHGRRVVVVLRQASPASPAAGRTS